MTEKTYRITGKVINDKTHTGIPGLRVEAWDNDLIFDDFVGSAVTDEEGSFLIEFKESYFSDIFLERSPDLFFKIFPNGERIFITRNSILWNVCKPELDIVIEIDLPSGGGGGGTNPNDSILRVYGIVRNEFGEPLDGVTVQAFDRDMRSEQLLGSVLTKAGNYEIRYLRSQFLKAEKDSADLVVKVLDDAGKEELHKTPIQYNVPNEIEVNVVLQGGEYKGPSEFDVLTETFTPLLEGTSPLELREDDQFQDISFLSGETGHSQLIAGTWVACHRLVDKTMREKTPLEAAVFFGFMRQGQPSLPYNSLFENVGHPDRITLLEDKILRDLANINPELQQSLLEKAITDNLISGRIKPQIPTVLETLRQIKLRYAADTTFGAGKGTIGQLLDLTPSVKEKQTVFMAAFTDFNGPINEFWKKLETDKVLKPEEVREVKLTFELGALTRNHIPLVGELKNMFQRTELQQKRELAKFGREDWIQIFKRPGPDGNPIGVPANIDGKDDEAKFEQYAVILDQRFERSYPTTSFAAKLTRTEQSPVVAKTDVVRFIENNTKFHLDRYRIDHFIAENKEALKDIENKDVMVRELKSIQRVFKLNPTHLAVDALLTRKLDSAQQIYFMGKGQFVTMMMDSGINKIEARKLYYKSENAYSLTLNWFGLFNNAVNGVVPFGVPTPAPNVETQAKIAALPNLQTLFGSLDFCECSHCRSVYSPAAYFVDVMHYLGQRGTQGSKINMGKNVKQVLLERRPDLGEIELSCENTNTPLPYIDLVNEILEDVVAPPTPVTLNNAIEVDLTPGKIKQTVLDELAAKSVAIGADAEVYAPDIRNQWAIRDQQHAYKLFKTGATLRLLPTKQSFLSAAELRANPEYTNKDAYDELKQEVFPLNFPFDLWTIHARIYLNHLGVQQPRLLKLFQQKLADNVTLSPSDLQIDCAWLGITETERQIVTGALPGKQPWEFWGLADTGNNIPNPENPADPTENVTGTWINVLSSVNVMLHRSGLAYKELLQLLDMKYVNPTGSISIFDTADSNAANCDTSKFTIRNLTEDGLNRMHRFIRLWRKLGCAMWELDLLLPDVNADPNIIDKQITDGVLQDISKMNRLREQFDLDWRITYSLYNDIDHNIYFDRSKDGVPAVQTLYQRLFRNKLVDAVAVFPESPDQISGPIADKIPGILAAFRIKEADLNLILTDLSLATTDTLDWAVLSRIYRITVLAKTLSLSVDSFLRLKQLWAQDPFVNPAATRSFVKLAEKVADSGFSVLELDYLLAHRFTSNSGVALEDKAITAVLQTIREGLQKISDDLRLKPEETPEAYVKSKLGLLPVLVKDADQVKALAIIDGTWQGITVDRDKLIDSYFVDVLDLATAKTNLAAIPGGLSPSDHQAEVDKRFKYVQYDLQIFLLNTQSEAFIQQKAAELFQLDAPTVNQLLTRLHLSGTSNTLLQTINDVRLLHKLHDGSFQFSIDEINFPEIFKSLRLLHKNALLIGKLNIKADELTWWLDGSHATDMAWMHPKDFPIDNTTTVPIAELEHINDFFRWKSNLPKSDLTAFEFLDKVLDAAITAPSNITVLSNLTAWEATDITDLVSAFRWDVKQEFKIPESLLRLTDCMQALRRLGVNAARAIQWAKAEPTFDDAESLKQTVKSKYDLTQWQQIIKPIQDEFREQKRMALVSWLVTHPNQAQGQNWSDANGLYSYFLIDVEMSACMLTSRLKQAAASAQLFVQRCLMNLEVDILAKTDLDPKWKQWKWMKYYRVWEANRKVFLYPENWIEPELRDEKSPFFKDLENELMQNDVTNDIAEQAYLNYLEKLDKVANLEIRAMYNQVSQDESALHVFGRSRSSLAPEYYYRKRINGGRWVAWQKVELEINANLLAPSVFNNRLYLFWPQFIEKANAPTQLDTPQAGQSNTPLQQPDKYWEVRLFWSELKKGKWTPKTLSDKFATLRQNEATYEDLALRLTTADIGNMVVKLFDSGAAKKFAPGNHFDFNVIGKQIDMLRREWKLLEPTVKTEALLETRTEGSSLETLCLVVAPNSQVRDGLIMNYDKNVYYNYSLQLFESTKSVVTKTTKPPEPPAVKNYLSGPRGPYDVDAMYAGPIEENHFPTSLLIEKDSEISVRADIDTRGLKFGHAQTSPSWPDGGAGEAGANFPMTKGNPGAFLAKIKPTNGLGPDYYQIGKESTFKAVHEGHLSFLFNDNDNEQNSGFVTVNITAVKRPDPKASSPFVPVVTVEKPPPIDPLRATDNRNSQMLMRNGVPDSFTVVDSYDRSFNPKGNDQFFFWDKYRTYFVDYQGDPQTAYYSPNNYSPAPQAISSYSGSDSSLIYSFRFHIHYHPFAELFAKELNVRGIKGLLNRRIQIDPASIPGSPVLFDFDKYDPNDSFVVGPSAEVVDFTYEGAYAPYNWELFFHVPFFIANKLSTNQRFEEALEWFHYIFNPTNTDNATSNLDTPQQKFWITKPFYETTRADYYKQKIENIMLAIAKGDVELGKQVKEWRNNPFNPHLIARMRTVAYQKNVLIKYIQMLIAWGDQLFRRDTIETVNEATQLYIVAASILGPRPKSIPKKIANPIKTFYQLEQEGIDDFGNVLKQVENLLPTVSSASTMGDDTPELPRLNVLYFCIPNNEKLLTLWDTVADRLFKIRHCMNIEGVVRQLPLFEPPIDPALLVKAAAAGLDIGSVLNDMNAPMPLYRFTFMIQRALEICSEIKSLGGAMLAALEKRDAEAFTLLRSSHERTMLDQVRFIKTRQVNEALRAKEAMDESKKITEEKKNYHQKLISDGWSAGESTAFGLSTAATVLNAAIAIGYGLAGGLKLVPSFLAGGAGVGGTPTVHATFGGKEIGGSAEMAVSTLQSIAAAFDKGASLASTVASYERRSAEWEFQKRVAEKELAQMDKQIAAADIRHQIATQDLANQDKQIENAQKEDEYMRTKFTNQELYDWMISQISTVYFQSYQLAYDIAKRAERCFRYELSLSDSNYIQFGYWDSLKKGLLSGDKLFYDLKRLETAYYEQNRREYELTKHISLTQLDPIALLKLRQNGECIIEIPETVFDMDYPGHYFRRLKTVGLSIPCIAGPYTTIPCTLTLISNRLRKDATSAGIYERQSIDDSRFRDEIAAIQSIATSSAQNDHGMFELNFRDERYLPFEGAGAISTWQIKLNNNFPQFDLSTITDVIIHLNYTAREGGELLKSKAVAEFNKKMNDLALAENKKGLFRVYDLKREYSDKWYKFLHPANATDDQQLVFDDLSDRLPFFTKKFTTKKVKQIEVVALAKNTGDTFKVQLSPLGTAETNLLSLGQDPAYQGLHRAVKDLTGSEVDLNSWTLKIQKDAAPDFKSLPADAIEELFLIINYTIA